MIFTIIPVIVRNIARLHSAVGCKFRDCEFESKPSHITSIEINHKIIYGLPSADPERPVVH